MGVIMVKLIIIIMVLALITAEERIGRNQA